MIARVWRGRTPAAKADAYAALLERTGLSDYRATPGNRGVLALRRVQGDVAEFELISFWESFEAIRRFAGVDEEKAFYYPEDDEYLLEKEPGVAHYEVLANGSFAKASGRKETDGRASRRRTP
jgi:heme-degrading monooxygenase HmoA